MDAESIIADQQNIEKENTELKRILEQVWNRVIALERDNSIMIGRINDQEREIRRIEETLSKTTTRPLSLLQRAEIAPRANTEETGINPTPSVISTSGGTQLGKGQRNDSGEEKWNE
ncbi:hypothetical protein CDD81_7272 [Ophiocordyceps australis]|uniref:Uncharacterized protein n=1 Tax=Ophiocordyceps australis TaxID=1399860 RepID=A0A2C5Y5P0_9HYPO|nr:hypothetical protein CDD81_7272 [Ophiocordyceps australis]